MTEATQEHPPISQLSSAWDGLAATAAKSGCDHDTLARFTDRLEALPPLEAARINPFTFAEQAGIDAEMAVDLFVHGTRLGLFDLEWGTVCPLCGAITNSVAELDQIAADMLHCALCMQDAPSVLDDTVEVIFAYTPDDRAIDLHVDFPAYQRFFTSTSYPYFEDWRGYHDRYTLAGAKLQPGESAALKVAGQVGEVYRLLCLDVHAGATLRILEPSASNGPAPYPLSLTANGFSEMSLHLPAGGAVVMVTNDTDQAVWCRVLRIDTDAVAAIIAKGAPVFGRRLTGKHLINNQAFRDNFAMDQLAPDLKLKLRSLTLLFTDLKGSTALYDREGDLDAYRLVQDHFDLLKEVVRTHSGALIKTMGDAVMAAFPTASDGAAAAIDMMAAIQKLAGTHADKEIGLKVGLHAGPALAINAGRSLDYFGQTVNIAARVQGLADAGEICMTEAVNTNESVRALLADAGYTDHQEHARLKGVSSEELIHRYNTPA